MFDCVNFLEVYLGPSQTSVKTLFAELINPSRPNLGRRDNIKLNFYFHTSLWCLKWFYEDLRTFWIIYKTLRRNCFIVVRSAPNSNYEIMGEFSSIMGWETYSNTSKNKLFPKKKEDFCHDSEHERLQTL